MEVARGVSAGSARRARPQSAGPLQSPAGGNPRGHHRPVRPGSARPPSAGVLLPGEGRYVRTGSESPPGTGAASPPMPGVDEGQVTGGGSEDVSSNHTEMEQGGWRQDDDHHIQATGPYAVREVYGV